MNIMVKHTKALRGTIQAPPSKSETIRAFLVAAVGQGVATIENPSLCEDAIATLRVITQLGAKVSAYEPLASELRNIGVPVLTKANDSVDVNKNKGENHENIDC